MINLGPIEPGISAATPPAGARPETPASAGADPAVATAKSAEPPLEERERRAEAIDEQALDRMALRLIKRDPGLAIEKDDVVRRYVYRFFDAESGDQIRQFPADRVLETMRALRQAAAYLSRQNEGPDVAV